MTDAINTASDGFDLIPGDEKPKDVGSWIKISQNYLTLPAVVAGEHAVYVARSARTRRRATTPAASSPVARPAATDKSVVKLDRRAGSRVDLRVSGPVTPALVVEHLSSKYDAAINSARRIARRLLHRAQQRKRPSGRAPKGDDQRHLRQGRRPEADRSARPAAGNAVTITEHFTNVAATCTSDEGHAGPVRPEGIGPTRRGNCIPIDREHGHLGNSVDDPRGAARARHRDRVSPSPAGPAPPDPVRSDAAAAPAQRSRGAEADSGRRSRGARRYGLYVLEVAALRCDCAHSSSAPAGALQHGRRPDGRRSDDARRAGRQRDGATQRLAVRDGHRRGLRQRGEARVAGLRARRRRGDRGAAFGNDAGRPHRRRAAGAVPLRRARDRAGDRRHRNARITLLGVPHRSRARAERSRRDRPTRRAGSGRDGLVVRRCTGAEPGRPVLEDARPDVAQSRPHPDHGPARRGRESDATPPAGRR